MSSEAPQGHLTQDDWTLLLARIEAGACTPFVGAGVHDGHTPLPGDVAMQWAETHGYPLEDRWNLARVGQFMAIEKGPRWPRNELAAAFIEAKSSRPADAEPAPEAEALKALAELPFRTYVTTTPDDWRLRPDQIISLTALFSASSPVPSAADTQTSGRLPHC